ncbi:MAG: peptidylprolyl isomerase [Dehalococcoidia bacterium]|nr:peptidylprolyl isomerase [Dehalococcoidia bacterium]
MPFPWLGRLGAANAGRSGRRRNRRAQKRSQGEVSAPQEDIQVITQRRQRRIGFGIGSVLILTIIGVVLLGYYQEFYRPPRVWAGSVRNVEFTMGDLVARIRVLQGVNRYQGGQVNLSRVPFEYLQNLVNAEILRQRSPVLGIQIQDDDIEQELRRQFLPTADPGEETDPGQLESEFRNSYGGYLTATGLSDADFRVIVEEQLAQRALALSLAQEIEPIQPHVEVQWIQIPMDGEILIGDVAQRLANEDFTRVAQELNSANQFADPNGYVGWVPKGAFPDLDDYLYGNEEDEIAALKPGLVSGPIFTADAHYLLKVLAAAEDRELNNTMGQKLLQENVLLWQREALVAGTTAGTVRMNFNSRLYDWVTNQVFITAPRIDRPTPVPDLISGVPLPGPGP